MLCLRLLQEKLDIVVLSLGLLHLGGEVLQLKEISLVLLQTSSYLFVGKHFLLNF